MKNLRTIFITLSMVSNFVLILATVAAFIYYTTDAALIFSAFTLTALSITNSVLSLHFRTRDLDD